MRNLSIRWKILAGVVLVNVNPAYRSHELRYVLRKSRIRALFLHESDPRANYRVFNVGGGRTITVKEYARLIAQRMGQRIEPLVPGEFRFGDTRHIFSDISNLQSLGWKPQVPFEKIVEEYVAWAREQPDVKDYYADAEKEMLSTGTIRKAK